MKLTTYLGERDRADGGFLADALLDCYQRHGFRTSVLLRGALGFGIGHHLRTDRLLTLSEDLPVISVAVDTRARIEAALPEVRELTTKGLVTLERARLVTERLRAADVPDRTGEHTKLTVYVGRKHRIAGSPAYVGVVETLHRLGVAGATVLLGVDGTLHGTRQRATFFGRNADVPMMIISIGTTATTAAALEALAAQIDDPLATLERVIILKRDGERIADLPEVADADASGLNVSQKLMIYTGEQSRDDGQPIYQQLVRSLREARRRRRHQCPRHLGLPRCPPTPRRPLLQRQAPRAGRHGRGRRARADPRALPDRRPPDPPDRPRHLRGRPGIPRDRHGRPTGRPAHRGPFEAFDSTARRRWESRQMTAAVS